MLGIAGQDWGAGGCAGGVGGGHGVWMGAAGCWGLESPEGVHTLQTMRVLATRLREKCNWCKTHPHVKTEASQGPGGRVESKRRAGRAATAGKESLCVKN